LFIQSACRSVIVQLYTITVVVLHDSNQAKVYFNSLVPKYRQV
jgi:hypothetical protein